jgi:DNA-binding IclR family transcriptional regulator
MKPTRTVKTADTLLRVINHLQRLDGAGVTELADHLGLAKSTTHDHLATLRGHGYVTKRDNTYHLGLRFLDHGTYVRERLPMDEAIRPSLRHLAADTRDTAYFVVEEHGEAVYLERCVGERGVDIIRRPGKRASLHVSAAGKAIMANFSNDRVRTIATEQDLERRTQNTITNVDSLLEDLEAVRGDGVAITVGEDTLGVTSVAASVSEGGETLGAISVSGPQQRFTEAHLADVRAALLAAVNEAELRISMDNIHDDQVSDRSQSPNT